MISERYQIFLLWARSVRMRNVEKIKIVTTRATDRSELAGVADVPGTFLCSMLRSKVRGRGHGRKVVIREDKVRTRQADQRDCGHSQVHCVNSQSGSLHGSKL